MTQNQMTIKASILSTLAVLALAAGCSGGADTSPMDVPAPSTVSEALSAPSGSAVNSGGAWASTHGDGQACDGRHPRRDPAAFLKRFDKNGDGKLQVAELPDKMKSSLGKADTNGDGVLSAEEVAAHRAEMRKERRDPAAMVKRFDKNGDGKLQVSELPARMHSWVDRVDTNKDGVIGVDEIAAARDSMEKARFEKTDKNADGLLTAVEVGPRKWEHLKRADADGNGAVTLAEFDQAVASGTLPMRPGPRFHRHGRHAHGAGQGTTGSARPEKS